MPRGSQISGSNQAQKILAKHAFEDAVISKWKVSCVDGELEIAPFKQRYAPGEFTSQKRKLSEVQRVQAMGQRGEKPKENLRENPRKPKETLGKPQETSGKTQGNLRKT